MSKHTELPAGNLLFSIVLNSVDVRVVKRSDACFALRTGSRRRGCRGSRTRRWRGRGVCIVDLEIIGLGAVIYEVAISADPDFVFSTRIRRVIVPGNSEATGTCL